MIIMIIITIMTTKVSTITATQKEPVLKRSTFAILVTSLHISYFPNTVHNSNSFVYFMPV